MFWHFRGFQKSVFFMARVAIIGVGAIGGVIASLLEQTGRHEVFLCVRRPLELDARNGVIVRLGQKHGIPTPSNRMAVALLTAMVQKMS
jgi:ketopantoate reductase